MASPPSSSVIPPSSSVIPPSSSSSSPPPPPSSLSPPPSASQPPSAHPNATSESPASSETPPPLASTSPPPAASPPPPSLPNSPPPAASPPPTSLPNSPLPAANSPPPASPSPPPPTSSPPPSSSPSSTPTLTPPPSKTDPPSASPPLPSLPTLPPPPSKADPPSASPPLPSLPTLPPPAPPTSSPPPAVSPPSPLLPTPPATSSPPPPSANPPVPSPPTPVSESPPPSRSQTPPSTPSAPPPKEQPPPVPSPPSPPSSNSSSGTPPVDPSVPSPLIPSISPPLPSPNNPPGDPTNVVSPSGNKSSTFGPNVTAGTGDGNSGGGGGSKTGVVLPVAVVTSFLVLSLVGLAVWYFRKRKRRNSGYAAGFVMPSPLASSQMSESPYPRSPTAPLVYHSSGMGNHGYTNSPPDPGLGNSKSWFSYDELYKVTNGFSAQNLLGEGGFGCVYKGHLPDGREVAVKQLKVGGSQGEREFRAEVEIIGRVHHRHLVSLVGYCIVDSQRLLVYDYVPNNTLHHHLHAEGRPVMDWAIRVKVAAGAARGLAYLHEDCHPRIIHRDIKSSNILLDNNFEAQVSDFGLARLAMDAVTHVTTRVMGTFGYLAPEYASSGKLTERSDVYSFGVVLLELITGKLPVDSSQPLGDESLVEWARPLMSRALEIGDFDGLPDPRLEKNYNEAEMFRMIATAAACVRHSAAMRPRMGMVVRALDGLADIDLSNGIRPGQSELFSAQSAEIRLFQRMAFGSQDYSTDFSNFSNCGRTSWKTQRDS